MPSRTGELPLESGGLPEAAFAAAMTVDAKSLQLCAQARRALEFAMGGACRDEVLTELVVVEVLPDPTARRLRVWLRGPVGMDEDDRAHVLRRLAGARGFLRAEVAAAIHRKRTPELVFELLGAVPDGERQGSLSDARRDAGPAPATPVATDATGAAGAAGMAGASGLPGEPDEPEGRTT